MAPPSHEARPSMASRATRTRVGAPNGHSPQSDSNVRNRYEADLRFARLSLSNLRTVTDRSKPTTAQSTGFANGRFVAAGRNC